MADGERAGGEKIMGRGEGARIRGGCRTAAAAGEAAGWKGSVCRMPTCPLERARGKGIGREMGVGLWTCDWGSVCTSRKLRFASML